MPLLDVMSGNATSPDGPKALLRRLRRSGTNPDAPISPRPDAYQTPPLPSPAHPG